MSEAPFLFCIHLIKVRQHSAQAQYVLIILIRYKYYKFYPRTSTAEIAQLGERQTEDLKVPGSNPENSHEFWIIPGLGKDFFLPICISIFLSSNYVCIFVNKLGRKFRYMKCILPK